MTKRNGTQGLASHYKPALTRSVKIRDFRTKIRDTGTRLVFPVLSRKIRDGWQVWNCRCDVSAFDLRKSMCRPSKIDVTTFKDRCIAFRRWTIDVTMCRPSEIDVLTFEDRCVDLRRSMIDVSTFEDRWLMCRPSKIDGRCEIRLLYLLKTLIL